MFCQYYRWRFLAQIDLGTISYVIYSTYFIINAELPLRSWLNSMEQFNDGNFDCLIATNESTDANGHT
jgi:hypothetical protein